MGSGAFDIVWPTAIAYPILLLKNITRLKVNKFFIKIFFYPKSSSKGRKLTFEEESTITKLMVPSPENFYFLILVSLIFKNLNAFQTVFNFEMLKKIAEHFLQS